ncbi:MAG: chemotaxis protein CheW [Pseudomonadota bacterium]
MHSEDDEPREIFVQESLEHLSSLESDLLAIEDAGGDIDKKLIDDSFRAVHSIKGVAAFLGYVNIKELAHKMESILGMIRSGKFIPDGEVISILLLAADALRNLVNNAATSNEIDISEHIEALSRITPAVRSDEVVEESTTGLLEDGPTANESDSAIPEQEMATTTSSVTTAAGGSKKEVSGVCVDEDPEKTTEEKPGQSASSAGSGSSLRVNVALLDSLMNLAGELVLGRNQLIQAIAVHDVNTIEIAGQRLDNITCRLQEDIMLTRMQPIGTVFEKFRRVVRDMGKSLGKDVQLVLEGSEVELDKTIIEAIGDPLAHLVRNSVDHGIESPDERLKTGKSPKGEILLTAYHEAGHVNIEIADDGKGMDGNRLAAEAVANGLISKEKATMMSDKEKLNLIFLPGFSMAEKVTDVSGRGVGMDVVKTNIDKLGGVADIESRLGKGTTIRIKLPLTLAIIPSQIIFAGGERYAVPQVNVQELLRIPANQAKEKIERVGDAEVVRLRGKLLPVIRLADVFGIERTYRSMKQEKEKPDHRENIADRRSTSRPSFEDETLENDDMTTSEQQQPGNSQVERRKDIDRRYHAASAINIVVVSSGNRNCGLIVDNLQDSEEIVVKPLGRHLKRCQGYAGATIMGDGQVALILDVAGIAEMAALTAVEDSARGKLAEGAAKSLQDIQSLLVFMNGENEQCSVPLDRVERIDKIKVSDIEQIGGNKVIKYRGGSLPLFAVEEVAKVKPLADREELVVIIFALAGREVGLLATPPVDAVEQAIKFDASTLKQPGIMGSAIIGDRTTLMVDMVGLVETLHPDWFMAQETVQTLDGQTATILLAEDSNFFRGQVKGFIKDEGYNVIEAEDGMVAWNLLQENAERIDLVVTDIEMPNLDGFSLTTKIRQSQRFRDLPVIALTSLAGEEDIERGKAVSVDDYQIKMDREKLIESINNYLSKGRGQ